VSGLIGIITAIIQVYAWIIIARVILTWFPRSISPGGSLHGVYVVLFRITEPFLNLFRRLLPQAQYVGGLDFTPMLAVLVLWVVQALVVLLI
jgi:YggT family protein